MAADDEGAYVTSQIYLDNNATTRIHPEVADAIARCWSAGCVNPSSQHQAGQHARHLLEEARESVAEILGANSRDQVVFTSGGTEANNLALLGLADGTPAADRANAPSNIVVSAIEHPSVALAAEQLGQLGHEIRILPVASSGVVDVDRLPELFDDQTRLVSVMLGNNETGVLQPVENVAEICQSRGIALHTDAIQAIGKIPVAFSQLKTTTLSVAAHKFHGPVGVGALLVREGVQLQPRLFGGFQQMGLRPGTESVALAVGLHKALQLWRDEHDRRQTHLRRLRDRFESLLTAELPDVVIVGADAPRLPQTSNVAFLGLDRQALFLALDVVGVTCSTGSACSSGSSEPSPVLLAMRLPEAVVAGSLRFSFGTDTTDAEADLAARRIIKVVTELRHGKLPGKSAATARQAAGEEL